MWRSRIICNNLTNAVNKNTTIFQQLRDLFPEHRQLQRFLDANPGAASTKDPATGNTVLMEAVKFNDADVCMTLMKKGANIEAVNARGEKAINFAVGQNCLMKLLYFGAEPQKEKYSLEKLNTKQETFMTERVNCEKRMGKLVLWSAKEVSNDLKDTKFVHHLRAPILVLTPRGYVPKENPDVKMPIRFKKRRRQAGARRNMPNWQCPRG